MTDSGNKNKELTEVKEATADSEKPSTQKEKKQAKKEKKEEAKEEKKEEAKEEKNKKILPKFYSGSNVQKLPKVPSTLTKDLDKITALTNEQLKKLLTLQALGLVEGDYGLPLSTFEKQQAIKMLAAMNERDASREDELTSDEENLQQALLDNLQARKIDGVDE